jgi:hypothetical protein
MSVAFVLQQEGPRVIWRPHLRRCPNGSKGREFAANGSHLRLLTPDARSL